MPLWRWLTALSAVLLALLLLYGIGLVLRRRWIARAGGTFEASVRVHSRRAGRGWLLGVGRYSGDILEWFRIFSLVPRPRLTLNRSDVSYAGRREPVGAEIYSLFAGHVVVACVTSRGPLEVAMSPEALTGFLAWLESGPPGRGSRPV